MEIIGSWPTVATYDGKNKQDVIMPEIPKKMEPRYKFYGNLALQKT